MGLRSATSVVSCEESQGKTWSLRSGMGEGLNAGKLFTDYKSASRNSRGETILIFRNGFNTCKSPSPLMMKSALPLTASSRNLSSFGSRHSLIFSLISTRVDSFTNRFRNRIRSSSSVARSQQHSYQRQIASPDQPFRIDSRISGVRPRSWALRLMSSINFSRVMEGFSNSRSHRLRSNCIFFLSACGAFL